MSINIKKYTKDQMAKMMEEAAERLESQKKENAELAEQLKSQTAKTIALRNDLMAKAHSVEEMKAKNVALTEQISQMNGEAINRANEIANLKTDADALRNKLADTEAALGRSANEASRLVGDLRDARMQVLDLGTELDVAHNHPWRNLWAWIKRKLKMA